MAANATQAPPAEVLPVLLAEHASLALAPWVDRLREAGHAVAVATGPAAVLEELDRQLFGAVLLDACLPTNGAADWCALVRAIDADVPVLVVPHNASCHATAGNASLLARHLEAEATSPAATLEALDEALALHRVARSSRVHAGNNHLAAMPAKVTHALREQLQAATQRLYMAYQPIVGAKDGALYGYEALVRTGEQSLATPAALFDAAERLGALFLLGRRIRAQVAEDLATLGLPDGSYVFVNLHARDLLDDELFDVRAPLAQHADRIILEITERTALDAIADVDERLSKLRLLGFRLAIDDLGAGFAGLNALATLDLDVIKLDMSLVRDLHQSARKQAIVTAVTRLAGELHVAVVAEGVETELERAALIGCGCELLQGYLFGRPNRGFQPPLGT